jgi:predicted amidohydrolase YtcJ
VAARLTTYIVALIVATTFIAGLIVGAQREDGPVDVMVVNGHIYTADGKQTDAEAVAIQGNKILQVGTTREIQRLRRPQTMVIDAKGGAVIPGRIERNVDFLNTTANPAVDLLPKPTRDEELATLRAATKDAHRRGVTSVHTAGSTPDELELFDALRGDDSLQLRVYGDIAVDQPLDKNALDALDDVRQKYEDDPVFKAGAARIVVDEGNANGFTPESLGALIAELDKRGWQLSVHAIGDTALRMALDAYHRAIEINPAPARGRRHFIAAESTGPVDYSAFDKLGIVSALRPGQLAWASFDEQRKGELERDMLADLVILSDGAVALTIFDGKVVFKKVVETDN